MKVLNSSTATIAISFVIYVANILEKNFLVPFQSDKPNIHLVYNAMGDLLYSLMINFIRKESVGGKDAYKLGQVEVKKVCRPLKEILFGKSTEDLMLKATDDSVNKKQKSEDIQNIKDQMKSFYIEIVELQKKLKFN